MSQPSRILIVDDDPIITKLISIMLQKKGYHVVGVVASGEESILRAAELNPDLVIMDVSLAGEMDGLDAAHYIFQLFQYPIIFITAMSEEELFERAKYSQPYGIIFKPFTMLEISTNVDLAIYNHGNRCKTLERRHPAGDPKKIMEALEAIFITDKRGRIIFFNPYAAWFFDIPEEQILMKHWREVFMMLNDMNDEELKDPVDEASRQMAGVNYDSNTSVVTTTSKRRKVSITVRPVKDDHERLLAVLVSIKEKKPKP
ncbi:response regulator [uncultured Methanoregula sp.]|uniref:ATP-binding response regulator n=1 Tax=uncultured Methanoregula sp. TaxID=1005933 RepID=UPI002AAC23D6|nr:response regulator [uncultured Methanoregula sp.]